MPLTLLWLFPAAVTLRFSFDALFLQQAVDLLILPIEDSLHPEGVGAGPYHAGGGPASQGDAEGVNQNGFAGPGLPGEHREASGKIHFRVFY